MAHHASRTTQRQRQHCASVQRALRIGHALCIGAHRIAHRQHRASAALRIGALRIGASVHRATGRFALRRRRASAPRVQRPDVLRLGVTAFRHLAHSDRTFCDLCSRKTTGRFARVRIYPARRFSPTASASNTSYCVALGAGEGEPCSSSIICSGVFNWATSSCAVSYTHLDVYKRQA